MARIVLHLGDHKTGTSSLQRLCAAGHTPPGVLYPVAGRANGAGHHNLAWAVGADPRFRPAKGAWPEVWEEIARAAPHTALISSEAFEFKRPKRVMAALSEGLATGGHTLEAAIYLRPHPARLLSSFSERVKRGIGPFDRMAFLTRALSGPRFRYAPRLDRWRRVLAPGALQVRIFSRAHLEGGDIIDDVFRRVLCATPPVMRMPPANETPCAADLRMMQLRKDGRRAQPVRTGGPKPRWTRREAALIRKLCAPDAQALDDVFGGDVFGAALDRAVDEAPVHDPCEGVWSDIMARRARAGVIAV